MATRQSARHENWGPGGTESRNISRPNRNAAPRLGTTFRRIVFTVHHHKTDLLVLNDMKAIDTNCHGPRCAIRQLMYGVSRTRRVAVILLLAEHVRATLHRMFHLSILRIPESLVGKRKGHSLTKLELLFQAVKKIVQFSSAYRIDATSQAHELVFLSLLNMNFRREELVLDSSNGRFLSTNRIVWIFGRMFLAGKLFPAKALVVQNATPY